MHTLPYQPMTVLSLACNTASRNGSTLRYLLLITALLPMAC